MDSGIFARKLTTVLSAHSTRPVVDDSMISLTGVEFLQRVDTARGLLGKWILPGDVVAVALPSSASYLVMQAALVDLGAVFIAVPSDAPYLMEIVRARCAPQWFMAVAGGEQADFGDAGLFLVDMRTATAAVAWMPRDDLRTVRSRVGRVVLATSGSTGVPKLVDLSPEAYWYAATSIAAVTGIDARDTVLHHLPVQRGAGWLLWGSILAGAHNLILPTRTADLPGALRDMAITATFSVSVGLAELISQDCSAESLPHLRTLYYSSGPVTVGVKQSLTERFGARLIQDYGMTEVPEPLTLLTREDHVRGMTDPRVLSSVGKAVYPDRVRVDPLASPHTPGGVWVRSPYMFDGYWGQQAAGVSRWYETDDLGYLDDEGYLHLVSRRSDSVRSGGVSFALSDLRRQILSLHGVLDVELVVVSDHRLGERVRASVIAAADTGHSAHSITQQLRSALRDPRMIPSEIQIICAATTLD